jgi:cathepsin L
VEGVDAGKQWWMVKNSWGIDWGMGGFIAMRRNHANMCGIATDAVYATIS